MKYRELYGLVVNIFEKNELSKLSQIRIYEKLKELRKSLSLNSERNYVKLSESVQNISMQNWAHREEEGGRIWRENLRQNFESKHTYDMKNIFFWFPVFEKCYRFL